MYSENYEVDHVGEELTNKVSKLSRVLAGLLHNGQIDFLNFLVLTVAACSLWTVNVC